jgi:hypothetical protein
VTGTEEGDPERRKQRRRGNGGGAQQEDVKDTSRLESIYELAVTYSLYFHRWPEALRVKAVVVAESGEQGEEQARSRGHVASLLKPTPCSLPDRVRHTPDVTGTIETIQRRKPVQELLINRHFSSTTV